MLLIFSTLEMDVEFWLERVFVETWWKNNILRRNLQELEVMDWCGFFMGGGWADNPMYPFVN